MAEKRTKPGSDLADYTRMRVPGFFATREKINVGPYTSLHEAEIDIQVLIASLKNTQSEEEAIEVIQEFNNRERLRLL